MKKLTVSDETHNCLISLVAWELMKARDNAEMGEGNAESLRELETAMVEVKAAETIDFKAEITKELGEFGKEHGLP